MANSEKRNSTARIPVPPPPRAGVGGRHTAPPAAFRGGGYLDDCTISRLPVGRARPDARLDELRAMGLSGVWRRIAEAIGFEPFLVLWQLLDQASKDSQQWNHKGNIRLNMPSYKTFMRYQRNLWIQDLDSRGYNAQEIRALVRQETGENISLNWIWQIVREGKSGD